MRKPGTIDVVETITSGILFGLICSDMKITSTYDFKIILVFLKRKKRVNEITFQEESNSVVLLPRNYNYSF